MRHTVPPETHKTTGGDNVMPPIPNGWHILPYLFAILDDLDSPATLLDELMSGATDHMRTCASCRLGVHVLRKELEAARAAGRGQRRAHRKPDDAELARYISVASALGVEKAAAQFPPIAKHLQRCSECAEIVREELDSDDDIDLFPELDRDPQPQDAPTPGGAREAPAADVEQSYPLWVDLYDQQGRRSQLLLTPYVIDVGDLTVAITSAEPHAGINVEYASAPGFRSRSPEHAAGSTDASAESGARTVKQEQSFTLDLQQQASAEPWIRVKAHLQAQGTGRLICYLTSYHVASMQDKGTPIGGVEWLLERVDTDGARALIQRGLTSSQNVARVSWKQRGELRLTLRVAGGEWIVPLVIQG